jgi:ABC-2 type transport system permease protein
LIVPLAVVGALALTWLGSGTLPPDGWWRLSMLALAYAAYFGVVAGITLAASAFARSSRQALLLLLTWWAVTCVAWPSIAMHIAGRLHPAPSGLEFASAIRERLRQISANSAARRQALEARLMAEYRVERVEDLPINVVGEAMLDAESEQDRVQNETFAELYDVYTRQERVVSVLGLTAPVLPLRALAMAATGADFAHHRHFADAAELNRQQMLRILNRSSASAKPESLREYADTGIFVSWAGRELWERVPPFAYTAPHVSSVISAHVIDLASLVLWTMGAAVAAAAALSRIAVVP